MQDTRWGDMVIYEDFNRLVSLSQQLADLVESLSDKVENLESIARYQENQINTLQEEVLRLNGIVDTW